ncbi:sigma-70 family RNA polymerase sigma factor [Brevibacillus porteri]|uniref:sigma-70 family RNA polymerase sigma factor n=1 Tax=Brevibacillus porteri TaxID=2126350 RepID=UPI003D21618F
MGAIRDFNPHLGHKDDVIPQYLRMVHRICNRHKKLTETLGVEYEDLYSIGCIGLCKAFDGYNPTGEKPAKFLSYAMVYVDGYVRNNVLDSGLIRVPRDTFKLVNRIKMHHMEDEDAETIAKKLGCRVATAERAKQASGNVTLSMETPVRTKRGDNLTVADVIAQEDDHSSVEVIEFWNSLTSREKEIVGRLLMGQSKGTISQEIGRTMQTLRVYTRQIREKFLAHIG